MGVFKRFDKNPLLQPVKDHDWEQRAAFNGCPVQSGKNIHFLYRAVSKDNVSTIGYAKSADGIQFTDRRQFILPEHDWERYGCEDPRVTAFEGKNYIFYTALSTYPFGAEGIKVAVA